MNIENEWDEITKIVNKSFFSSHYFSVATITDDGTPHLTPIGSLMLVENKERNNVREILCSNGKQYQNKSANICIMGINASLITIIKAIIIKRLKDPPGIRLWGTAGERRKATKEEIEYLHRRIQSVLPMLGKIIRHLNGYKILWGDMKYVRDIEFSKYEYVKFGKMTNQGEHYSLV